MTISVYNCASKQAPQTPEAPPTSGAFVVARPTPGGTPVPTRPPSRCAEPRCPTFATKRGRCDDHQPIAWAGRDDKAARYGISSGRWRTLKRRVTIRDNGCCYRCGIEQPDQADDPDGEQQHELDHIIPISEGGAVEDLDNLGLICIDCHLIKSKAEAARANRARRRRR